MDELVLGLKDKTRDTDVKQNNYKDKQVIYRFVLNQNQFVNKCFLRL